MKFQGKRAKLYSNLDWANELSFINTIVAAGHFQKTDKVLDVGTGTGIMARAVAPFVDKVMGIDISHDMLILGSPIENVKLMEGDIRCSGL